METLSSSSAQIATTSLSFSTPISYCPYRLPQNSHNPDIVLSNDGQLFWLIFTDVLLRLKCRVVGNANWAPIFNPPLPPSLHNIEWSSLVDNAGGSIAEILLAQRQKLVLREYRKVDIVDCHGSVANIVNRKGFDRAQSDAVYVSVNPFRSDASRYESLLFRTLRQILMATNHNLSMNPDNPLKPGMELMLSSSDFGCLRDSMVSVDIWGAAMKNDRDLFSRMIRSFKMETGISSNRHDRHSSGSRYRALVAEARGIFEDVQILTSVDVLPRRLTIGNGESQTALVREEILILDHWCAKLAWMKSLMRYATHNPEFVLMNPCSEFAYCVEAQQVGCYRPSDCRGGVRDGDRGIPLNVRSDRLLLSGREDFDSALLWTRHGALACRQASGIEQRGGYSREDDALCQAVSVVSCHLQSIIHVLITRRALIPIVNDTDGDSSQSVDLIFAPWFQSSSEWYPFHRGVFFSLQLCVLKGSKGEVWLAEDQTKALNSLIGHETLTFVFDGEGGENAPSIQYFHPSEDVNLVTPRWIVHLKYRISTEISFFKLGFECASLFVQLETEEIPEAGHVIINKINERGVATLTEWVDHYCHWLETNFNNDDSDLKYHRNALLGLAFKEISRGAQAQVASVSEAKPLNDIKMAIYEARLLLAQVEWFSVARAVRPSINALVWADVLMKTLGGGTRCNCKSGKDRTQIVLCVLKARWLRLLGICPGEVEAVQVARRFLWNGAGKTISLQQTGADAYRFTPGTVTESFKEALGASRMDRVVDTMRSAWNLALFSLSRT